MGNKREPFPFKGPFFPASFFNLDEESVASDFSFERFNSENLAEPKWLLNKDIPGVARQEKNIKPNYPKSTNIIEDIMEEEFGNKVFEDSPMDAPMDTVANYPTSDDFLDTEKDRSKNITQIGNIPSLEVNNKTKDDLQLNTINDNIIIDDDQILPFLGEINENAEPDPGHCHCVCDGKYPELKALKYTSPKPKNLQKTEEWLNISDNTVTKTITSQDRKGLTEQTPSMFKQPTQEKPERNRAPNDLLDKGRKSILNRSTTYSTYPPLVPTVLPFSTTPSPKTTVLVTSTLPTLPTPITTRYKQPMTRKSPINSPEQTQTQPKEKVPSRKLVYSNPPLRPSASVSVKVRNSIPKVQENISRDKQITTSISKPIYVMHRFVPTKTKKVPNKHQKQSSIIQLKGEQGLGPSNETDDQDSILSPNKPREHDFNGPKPIQTLEKESFKYKSTKILDNAKLNQPHKPWIPINQDNSFRPIKHSTKNDEDLLQFKTPKVLRHFPENMVKLIYTFHPSDGVHNTVSNHASNLTHRSDGSGDAATRGSQHLNASQTSQATTMHYTSTERYAPQTTQATKLEQTNSKENKLSVLTIQQIQRKGLNNLLSQPQNNDVNDITDDSNPTEVKVTEIDTLDDKTKGENDESKIRLSFNIPCPRSARYDLIMGFKFCI